MNIKHHTNKHYNIHNDAFKKSKYCYISLKSYIDDLYLMLTNALTNVTVVMLMLLWEILTICPYITSFIAYFHLRIVSN